MLHKCNLSTWETSMKPSTLIRRRSATLALFLLACTLAQHGTAQSAGMAPAPVVFFDIAGQDTEQLRNFYSTVFDWNIGAEQNLASPFAVAVTSPLQGVLRREATNSTPQNEVLLYLGVENITETLAAVTANGGGIIYPRIEVPGAVVMGLFTDPAGNRFGLIELENGKARVPAAAN